MKKKNEAAGGHPILGDPCTWIWVEKDAAGVEQTVGYVGTHVDDVQVCGDTKSAVWTKALADINSMSVWGKWKSQDIRYAGVRYVSTRTTPSRSTRTSISRASTT